jgi:cell division GTPase FtsZ
MSEFDIQTPDIPLPEITEKAVIADEKPTAFKLSFIGSGQGGSRLAHCFHSLGYRRVCAINTAQQDLATLPLPEGNKLAIGRGGGAGKDPAMAKEAFHERGEDVLDLMRRCFGPVYDRTIICIGAGGGTGAGTVVGLIGKARELQIANKCSSQQVGVIVALPKIAEGKRPNANAYWVLTELLVEAQSGRLSPLIILDNERISALYPGLAVDPFWAKANHSVCSLFDLFNTVSIQQSSYTSFDPSDWATLLDSGLIVFGATPVTKWQELGAISFALRDNLRNNILSGGINLASGSVGAAIVIASKAILNQVPAEHIDQAFDQLTRLLRPSSTVHRGIYSGSRETLAVYTVLGGLGSPSEKLAELRRLGDINEKSKVPPAPPRVEATAGPVTPSSVAREPLRKAEPLPAPNIPPPPPPAVAATGPDQEKSNVVGIALGQPRIENPAP